MKCHNYDRNCLSDVMLGTAGIKETIVRTEYESLDVLLANMTLLKADRSVLIDTTTPQQTRIRSALREIQNDYTFCVIDCAPDISMSVINALVASDDVIVPVTIDEFAFDGIREILAQIADVRKYYNPGLNLAGYLVTQYKDNDFCKDGVGAISQKFGKMFETKINWTQVVNRSTFAREPISLHSPRCGAARGYVNFTAEYERGIAGNG